MWLGSATPLSSAVELVWRGKDAVLFYSLPSHPVPSRPNAHNCNTRVMDEEAPRLVVRSAFGPSSLDAPDATAKVPITILTGFLGAGKSTLLNFILTQRHLNRRFAVIMNEFGDTATIERAVSIQATGDANATETWLELPNGCLCCTIKTSAMRAIEELLRTRRTAIDHILLETTGLADPFPIIESFWADEALECMAQLDGVVCLVDARNVRGLLHEYPVLQRQIVLADVLLVSKTDLLDSARVDDCARGNLLSNDCARVDELRTMLGEMNPLARIQTIHFGRIDNPDEILGLRAYGTVDCSFVHRQQDLLSRLATLSVSSAAVRSLRLSVNGPVDRTRFETWLFSLLWERTLLFGRDAGTSRPLPSADCILRAKGLLRIVSSDRAILVQAVQDLYDITEISSDASGAELSVDSVLVLLGSFQDEALIRASFMASVV